MLLWKYSDFLGVSLLGSQKVFTKRFDSVVNVLYENQYVNYTCWATIQLYSKHFDNIWNYNTKRNSKTSKHKTFC